MLRNCDQASVTVAARSFPTDEGRFAVDFTSVGSPSHPWELIVFAQRSVGRGSAGSLLIRYGARTDEGAACKRNAPAWTGG
jgi:hypothetical protein